MLVFYISCFNSQQPLYVSFIYFFTVTGVLSQESSCPVFGEDQQPSSSGDRNMDRRYYMNFNKPALCNGRVTSWQYCYYDSHISSLGNRNTSARFFVYRRLNETQFYEQVPGSAYTIILESQLVTSLGCANISLNETQQFQVKVNDIIGACIIDNSTLNSLYIVGSLRTGGLYRSDSFFSDSLSCEGLDPINTDLLSHHDDRTLHLSINIGMNYHSR